jgi:hypothetical protein
MMNVYARTLMAKTAALEKMRKQAGTTIAAQDDVLTAKKKFLILLSLDCWRLELQSQSALPPSLTSSFWHPAGMLRKCLPFWAMEPQAQLQPD